VRFVSDGDQSTFPPPPIAPPGSGAIEKIFTDYFASRGLASSPTEFSGRSDYGEFIANGIPAGGLLSGAEETKTAEEAARHDHACAEHRGRERQHHRQPRPAAGARGAAHGRGRRRRDRRSVTVRAGGSATLPPARTRTAVV
jgi:Zn-dependent M28 family amino/carboxypeptidase